MEQPFLLATNSACDKLHNQTKIMKQNTLFVTVVSLFCASSLFAGGEEMKQAAPPPPCDYGIGWYVAVDGGANVYQSFTNNFSRSFANGDVLDLHIDHNVGGYGGIKVGYVFGKGALRPALEEDLFYNGIDTDVHLRLNGNEIAHSSNLINSGAFMTNFILRFASWGKFQPYIGGGAGAYYAAAAGSDITFDHNGTTVSTGGGRNSGSFAFDALAGADYYFDCKWSIFAEYHYLEYIALDIGNGNHHLGQHLVGAGVRFHF
jgi:opacity protein-like surface antigen